MTDKDILNFASVLFLDSGTLQLISIAEIVGAVFCLFPQREIRIKNITPERTQRKLSKRTLTAMLLILLAIPLTIYIGVYF